MRGGHPKLVRGDHPELARGTSYVQIHTEVKMPSRLGRIFLTHDLTTKIQKHLKARMVVLKCVLKP